MAPFSFTIRRAPIELSCEVGSIAEAIGILQAEDTTVRTLIATADDLNGSNGEANAASVGDPPATAPEAPAKRRGRGANKDKGDPVAAQAPAPEAIPGAPAAAPDPAKVAALAAQNAAAAATGDVPDFLKRQDTAAPPLPPPAAPPAPPAPPDAPPSGVLAGKVIAELDKRAAAPGAGEALAGWLAQCGLVKAGTTYSDAIDAVRLLADDKVAVVAGQLGVA